MNTHQQQVRSQQEEERNQDGVYNVITRKYENQSNAKATRRNPERRTN